MPRTFAAPLLCLLALAACAPTLPQFDESEAAYILEEGDNAIRGQASFRPSGKLVSCAGEEVRLLPGESRYARGRVRYLFGTDTAPVRLPTGKWHQEILHQESRFQNFIRSAECDGKGRFAFSDVPDGSYFVVTAIRWHAYVNRAARIAVQEGYDAIMAPVSVAGGETLDLIMP